MKNLIVNIYKTLFFFDFAIVLVYYLPKIKLKNPVYSLLCNEGVYLAVMLVFTFVFWRFAERKKLKIFNSKNKMRNYSLGLLTAILPLGITVFALWIFKGLKFGGFNKASYIIIYLAVILVNTIATELLLRGYLFKLYRKFYNIAIVTVIITLLYISLNINIFSKGYIFAANMIIFNVLLCFLRKYTRSILAPVTAHFIFNTVSGLLFGNLSLGEGYPVLLTTVFSGKKYISPIETGIMGSAVLLALNILLCDYFILKIKNPDFKLRKQKKQKQFK